MFCRRPRRSKGKNAASVRAKPGAIRVKRPKTCHIGSTAIPAVQIETHGVSLRERCELLRPAAYREVLRSLRREYGLPRLGPASRVRRSMPVSEAHWIPSRYGARSRRSFADQRSMMQSWSRSGRGAYRRLHAIKRFALPLPVPAARHHSVFPSRLPTPYCP